MGGTNCHKCGAIDDEAHRINYCRVWSDRNLSRSDNKVDFKQIYSENRVESMKIVEVILSLWDLGNGRNVMREDPCLPVAN